MFTELAVQTCYVLTELIISGTCTKDHRDESVARLVSLTEVKGFSCI